MIIARAIAIAEALYVHAVWTTVYCVRCKGAEICCIS